MAGGHTLNLKQGAGPRSARHPKRIRAGQMFFPLHGDRRRRLTVLRIKGEWVRAAREGGGEVNLAVDRLLDVDEQGQGAHYRFHGWKPRRRGYRTELRVADVSAEAGRCVVVLPEWDPETEIEEALAALPEELRAVGAVGSCMANLSSSSAAGLEIHNCRPYKARGASREAASQHPEQIVEGQRFRRRSDGKTFRVLDAEGSRVGVWNGHRIVRLSATRLLATGVDGRGENFEYLGGGVAELRRRRAERRGTPSQTVNEPSSSYGLSTN